MQKVDRLFALYQSGAYLYSPQTYIRDVIAPLIGIEGHLTVKIARKTAANIFHDNGLSVSQVSQVLGHRKVETTERHYFRTPAQPEPVTNGMKSSGITRRM